MLGASTAAGKGSKELQELLSIISNADVYSERLREISSAEIAATKARKELTKAKDLDRALKDANEKRQAAITELKKAQAQAKTVFDQARDQAHKIMAEASKHLEDEILEAEATSEAIKGKSIKIDEILDQAIRDRTLAQDAKIAAQDSLAKIEATKLEIEEKKRSIELVLKQI